MQIKADVRVTKRTTVTLDEIQAAKLLRKAVGAPERACVDFDCGYDVLRHIKVTWTEES